MTKAGGVGGGGDGASLEEQVTSPPTTLYGAACGSSRSNRLFAVSCCYRRFWRRLDWEP